MAAVMALAGDGRPPVGEGEHAPATDAVLPTIEVVDASPASDMPSIVEDAYPLEADALRPILDAARPIDPVAALDLVRRARASEEEERGIADEAQAIRIELARELHDSVAQTLSAMLIEMENFKTAQYGRPGVLREIDAYQNETREVLGNIRNLLFDLRGHGTVAGDFVPSLRSQLREFGKRYGVLVRMSVGAGWPTEVSVYAASQIHRIVEEAMRNIWRHSGATRAEIRLAVDQPDLAVVTVRDNGRGLLPETQRSGLGIVGMRERAVLLGGQLVVLPASPTGTLVRAVFPRARLA